MPKNNKKTTTVSKIAYFRCPCGFSKNCDRICEMKSAVKRHQRFCVQSQQAGFNFEDELVINNLDHNHTKTITKRVNLTDKL